MDFNIIEELDIRKNQTTTNIESNEAVLLSYEQLISSIPEYYQSLFISIGGHIYLSDNIEQVCQSKKAKTCMKLDEQESSFTWYIKKDPSVIRDDGLRTFGSLMAKVLFRIYMSEENGLSIKESNHQFLECKNLYWLCFYEVKTLSEIISI